MAHPNDLESATSGAKLSALEEAQEGRCFACLFPFDFLGCVPMCVQCIPKNFSKIQDCTHLWMVFGIIFGMLQLILAGKKLWDVLSGFVLGGWPATIPAVGFLFAESAPSCAGGGTNWGGGNEDMALAHFYCAPDLMVFLVTPAIFYWWSLIQQYDEDMMKKKAQLQDLQVENQQLFSKTIKDMEGVLENQVENNSGLAEKSFDSKKRDFLRFVKAAKQKYAAFFSGSKGEIKQLTDEFRQFVKQWLIIFEEASVDPVNKPIQLAGNNQEDLDGLTTLVDIADWVIQKLGETKVNFISEAMLDNQKIINDGKTDERRIRAKAVQGKYGIIMGSNASAEGSILRICFEEWKSLAAQAARIRKGGDARQLALLDAGEVGFGKRKSITAALDEEQGEARTAKKCYTCECTWWRCTSERFTIQKDETDTSQFPFVCYILCANVVVLSREHAYMLLAIPVFIGALVLFALQTEYDPLDALSAVCYAVCILTTIVVLIRFEAIDEVLRLEAQVNEIKARTEALEGKQKRMNEFWGDVQNIADLWLHRTVPRLEVVKEAHSHLEDANPKDLLQLLAQTNKALQNMEVAVGPRQLWLGNGGITIEEKKRFGETMFALSNNTSLPAVVNGINAATRMIENNVKRASLEINPADIQLITGVQNKGIQGGNKATASMATYQLG